LRSDRRVAVTGIAYRVGLPTTERDLAVINITLYLEVVSAMGDRAANANRPEPSKENPG
jgi:hypothetical protein